MKIVMFSINPIYADVITGGASKHLFHVARYLGGQGHEIEILCAKPVGGGEPFYWDECVHVTPSLPFHLPFPQPYAISGADLALITQKISDALEDADRFYVHDGEWLIPDVYQSVPTIISFRDTIYPESVLGSFIGKGDDVICISPYSESVIKNTAGRFYPGLNQRIHLVYNGIDFEVFSKKNIESLAFELGVNPDEDIIILHPHRPEPGKGLEEAIQVVSQLVNDYHYKNVKALIPEWIGEMVSQGEQVFYQSMMDLMIDLGVRENFLFFPWMPNNRMPELYSLGDVTFCLGSFVETFGNVAYESLACQTPSVVANVGVHRTLMPDDLLDKVDYGDIDGAAGRVLAILKGEPKPWENINRYLRSNLDFNHQVTTYSEIILNCRKRDPLKFLSPEIDAKSSYQLAPWCYFKNGNIYHDYHAETSAAGILADMLEEKDVINYKEAEREGITKAEWDHWIEKTWIIPSI